MIIAAVFCSLLLLNLLLTMAWNMALVFSIKILVIYTNSNAFGSTFSSKTNQKCGFGCLALIIHPVAALAFCGEIGQIIYANSISG